jgi:hypothetical protein
MIYPVLPVARSPRLSVFTAGATFRVLKEKQIAKYGENRTRRLVLEAWDKLLQQ